MGHIRLPGTGVSFTFKYNRSALTIIATPFRRFFVGNGHPMTADLRAENAEIDVWKSIWKAEKLASIRENLHCSMGGVANNVADGGCDQLLENGQIGRCSRGQPFLCLFAQASGI